MDEVDEKTESRILLRARCRTPQSALFLDRDGVLIEDKHHLKDPDLVELCKGAKKVLGMARDMNCPVIIVSNQSGISRGLFGWEDYEKITKRMLSLLGTDLPIAAIYANAHGPESTKSWWRKPNPGMLVQAASDLNIDLSKSILVGDRLSDLTAGVRAGIKKLGHVRTGHGWAERERVENLMGVLMKEGGEKNEYKVLMADNLGGLTDGLGRYLG